MAMSQTKKKHGRNTMDCKGIQLGGDHGQSLGYEARLPRPLPNPISPAEKLERDRLAEYLHDDVCQFLSLAQIKLSMSRQTDDYEQRAQLAASAEDLVKRANRSVRAMMLQMVQPHPREADLVGDFHWVAHDIEQLYGTKIQLVEDGLPMGVQARGVLVKCLRELLVNVAKHANTNEASVTIARNGEMVQLIVSDEGQGFALDFLRAQRAGGGFGLSSIRKRVRTVGGQMTVRSQPAKGTTITIQVPAQVATSAECDSW